MRRSRRLPRASRRRAIPPAPSPAAAAAKPSAKSPEASDEAKEMASHKDSPVVKSITTVAKPGELPKAPAHNAMDLDGLDGK